MDWDKLHRKNISEYSLSRPKRAIYIKQDISNRGVSTENINSVLEEGAFSGKDTIFMKNELMPNPDYYCLDISKESLTNLKSHGIRCVAASAIFPFKERSIHITFHSGLIVLFDDDNTRKILEQQIYVTNKLCYVFCHNAYNFIDRFFSWWKRSISKRKSL